MVAAQRRRRWVLRFLDRRSHSGECLSSTWFPGFRMIRVGHRQ